MTSITSARDVRSKWRFLISAGRWQNAGFPDPATSDKQGVLRAPFYQASLGGALLARWRICTAEESDRAETDAIASFKAVYDGKRPFANMAK